MLNFDLKTKKRNKNAKKMKQILYSDVLKKKRSMKLKSQREKKKLKLQLQRKLKEEENIRREDRIRERKEMAAEEIHSRQANQEESLSVYMPTSSVMKLYYGNSVNQFEDVNLSTRSALFYEAVYFSTREVFRVTKQDEIMETRLKRMCILNLMYSPKRMSD